MAKTEHTPTPWEWQEDSQKHITLVHFPPRNDLTGEQIPDPILAVRQDADLDEWFDVNSPDAAFIVTACNAYDRLVESNAELLEACKRSLAALQETYTNEPDGCGCEMCEAMRDLELAIARATA